jgi:aspartyl-tRNA(Asn)/glutamyl-tRNA(Gln) amidotransferase subunit B
MNTEDYMVQGYLPTIGIECHVQLKTKTKLFSGAGNDARGAQPNTLVSHICLGMPGALPVLNEKAVEYAVRAALAFHVKPQKYSYFERKHYFYPDLPKGYQITQLDKPIVVGGYVLIEPNGKARKITLNRVQMEEDAGKNTHPAGTDYSLVDLNRAGTPLLEIVSEPDIHSALEAKLYAKQLHTLMRYADVSDADMYHGNMRFDVNVSVSKDPKQFGTRTETKNLNSFKSVEKAVEYEIKRQIELLEKGESIIQETRGWDDAKQRTVSQRSKEEAHDYRYFPEPDLPPIVLDDDYIAKIESEMPIMPDKITDYLNTLGLDSSAVETLIDTKRAALFVYRFADQPNVLVKRIANWLASDIQGWISENEWSWDELILDHAAFNQLVKLVTDNQVSSTAAKQVLKVMIKSGGDPLQIAKAQDVLQVSDEGEIEALVQRILAANPKAAGDIKAGEAKAIGFLVGQIMKESKGKANPALAQDLIKKQLGV